MKIIKKNIKENIKDPYKSGIEAAENGKSISYDPYRNMGVDYHKQQSLWHDGYNSVKK